MLVSNPLQRLWGSYPICNLSQFLRIVGLQLDIICIIGCRPGPASAAHSPPPDLFELRTT